MICVWSYHVQGSREHLCAMTSSLHENLVCEPESKAGKVLAFHIADSGLIP